MSKFLVIVFFIISFFSQCFPECLAEKRSNRVIEEFSIRQRKTNGLVLCGKGSSIPEESVDYFILNFTSRKQLKINESRDFFFSCVEMFIKMVNKDSSMKDCLSSFPFESTNLEFRISFQKSNGIRVDPPYVSYIALFGDSVYYSYFNNDLCEFLDDESFRETYKEGLKKCSN